MNGDEYDLNGNVNDAVREIQTWLRALARNDPEMIEINVDGIYGVETETAVIQFQKNNNLPQTGVVDYLTWRTMFERYNELQNETSNPIGIYPFNVNLNLNRISKGEQFSLIYILQVMLEAFSILNKDLFDVDINGIYDDKTEDAVKIFQDRNNLPMTDYVDKTTWDRLSVFYNNYISGIN